jgi:pyridoxamine 5'-phosphate oxidase
MTDDPRYREAMDMLLEWIREAEHRGEPEANTAALATADMSARPSVRTVYVQFTQDGAPAFFVNGKSGKGRQVETNPRVALCFFWQPLHRQIILEGEAGALEDPEADRLWLQRPRESALAAWASQQELPEGDTGRLQENLEQAKRAFDFEVVSRPQHWVGYRIAPDRIGFWNKNWRRAGRRLYERGPDGAWEFHRREP